VWGKNFPFTFDNKRLCIKSGEFQKKSLGDLFTRCSNDPYFLKNLKIEYDLENGFKNYHGEEALSHYHEAAYDAHMTAFVFAHVVKLKMG